MLWQFTKDLKKKNTASIVKYRNIIFCIFCLRPMLKFMPFIVLSHKNILQFLSSVSNCYLKLVLLLIFCRIKPVTQHINGLRCTIYWILVMVMLIKYYKRSLPLSNSRRSFLKNINFYLFIYLRRQVKIQFFTNVLKMLLPIGKMHRETRHIY